ncbi:PAS domain S-box protein [Flavobacterium sp. TAB 87]|uniref:PAS domain S-box protein n=1 Tax=Flavobacterium sp. TAB 87 TaxID=1729581 RepID=UPI00076C8345|nr:PAS domain S-box protein [Flavobacterium sp. TAB 87]KVV15990.1 Phytochrome-like protein cph1 [Flavobacterium sp. TAB 87]
MITSNDQHYFLNGGGEMGELIRAKDWTQTPLGSPENWPNSLKTMVSVLLNNPFGMYIAWGKEYTQIYNDAYIPILGKVNHTRIVGNSTRDSFAEIWESVASNFDQAMMGNPGILPDFLVVLDGNESTKNSYFDFAYSPILLENGEVGGVLVNAIETTTKKVAQDNLIESEERFKAMADNIPNLAWMANADGAVYWYNKQWYEYTGTTFEDMQGWGWQSVYKQDALFTVVDEWKRSLELGVPFEMSYPIRRADGMYRQFLTRALPVKNEDGNISTWFGTNTDITEQKVAEEALLESKNEIEFVIEAAKLGTFDYNPITDKFSANSRLKKWFGLSADEEINLNVATNVIVDEDRAKVVHAITKSLDYSSGGNYEMTYNIINPVSKKEITLHAKGKALFNANKQAFKLNGTVEDITAQTISRKKLEQSERSLKLMILQAPIAISIMRGTDYTVEIANKNALELWNRTEEQVLNKSIFEVLPELKSQGVRELLDDVCATGNSFSTTELPVELMRFGQLETVYVNFSYEALFDLQGNINGVMSIGFDVTAQVLARQEIEKSEQSIRSLVESAPFPIGVYTGKEMRITLANQAIIDAWGKQGDVIGKLYTEILPELENQNIYKQIEGVFESGIAFHAKNQKVEIEINGILKAFYFNYSFTPLRDSTGNIYGVMNTAAEVTALHEAKQKIEESEKRFRDAVQQAPTAMVIFRGKDNVVDMVNTPYLELVDKTEEEFLGKPLFESLPEVEEVIKPIIDGIYETENAYYGYEFPVTLVRYGKKEITYFNFVYHPLKEGNVVTGIMVVATEVTSNVVAKKSLKENEQRLSIIIEASELGVWELDLLTYETTISDQALEVLGLANEKFESHEQLMSKMHPDDLGIRKAAFEKALQTSILHYEIRTIVDDVIHWIEAKGKVFYDADKKPIRMLGTLRDVSDEKNIQSQLVEREQKFRLLADSMPQFVWTANPEGKLNYFNQSVFDFSGISREEITEKGWLQIVHFDEREENTIKWMESICTEKDFLIEHRFRKNDGTYRWQLSRAIPQRDPDGKITMWVGTSTDIQDQKMFTNELEKQVLERTKELNQKNDDLEKMNRELQSFAYISSHDLQEPLRKIQTFATQINQREAENLSDNGKDKFRRMQNAANRMQMLIQDLLAYSRTSVQERIFEKATLSEIIEEVKEDLEQDSLDKNTTITVVTDCSLEVIPFQFRQLLFNLISNSLKFTREGTIPKIVIECNFALGSDLPNDKLNKNKEYCHISIQDNGIGFEEEYNEKIFEVFQRLHGKEKFDGTGIGLAIVKKIVDNHNGVITATGVLNEGATFDIYLPVSIV